MSPSACKVWEMNKIHITVKKRGSKKRGKTQLHQVDQGHGLVQFYCCLAFQETELLAIAHLQ